MTTTPALLSPDGLNGLVQVLWPQGVVQAVRPLHGGVSAIMHAVTVQANGRFHHIIVRQHSHKETAVREYHLLAHLSTTKLPVPAPLLLDENGRYLGRPTLLLTHLPGTLPFTTEHPAAFARQLAEAMATIHQTTLPKNVAQLLPAHAGICAELERKRPYSLPFPIDQIEQRLAAHPTSAPLNTPTLLHGDLWPGNTLWQDGRLTAVIDWEDAMVGDPLIDFAQTRSELVWMMGWPVMENFSRHYLALTHIDTTYLPYWDLCAVLRFIRFTNGSLAEMAAFFTQYGRTDITPHTITQNVTPFIHQALTQLT